MFPYLDTAGFQRRVTAMTAADATNVEALRPGLTAQRLAMRSSWINARLRKRYGNGANAGNALPLGQQPPALLSSGTTPPPVSLVGRPILGSLQVQLQITTAGAVGTAAFKYSLDGTTPSLGPVTTAPVVSLPGTGMQVVFPSGAYSLDNLYAAATPVPETVLSWLVTMVTMDLYQARGVNPQDPQLELLRKDLETALEEVKEASDSKDGLFDLPAAEDADSAITTGGPLGYSEQSPYVWADLQLQAAIQEDATTAGVTLGGNR